MKLTNHIHAVAAAPPPPRTQLGEYIIKHPDTLNDEAMMLCRKLFASSKTGAEFSATLEESLHNGKTDLFMRALKHTDTALFTQIAEKFDDEFLENEIAPHLNIRELKNFPLDLQKRLIGNIMFIYERVRNTHEPISLIDDIETLDLPIQAVFFSNPENLGALKLFSDEHDETERQQVAVRFQAAKTRLGIIPVEQRDQRL